MIQWDVAAESASNEESAGPPHQVSTTANGSFGPHDIAFIGEASTSQLNASTPAGVNIDFAQSARDSLRASLALVEEDIVMHNAIKAAPAYNTALMVEHRQLLEMSGNAAREDARVTSALLRRLKMSTFSDDDYDINDSPEEAARHDLIRRRKTRRLIEKRKQARRLRTHSRLPQVLYLLTVVFLTTMTSLRFKLFSLI